MPFAFWRVVFPCAAGLLLPDPVAVRAPVGATVVVAGPVVNGTDASVRHNQLRPRRRPVRHRNGRSEAEEPKA